MSMRIIVTQQSRNTVAMTHRSYTIENSGQQIVADRGWEIGAVYIVDDNLGSVDGEAGNHIHLDGE